MKYETNMKKLNNGQNDVYTSFQPVFQVVWLLGIIVGGVEIEGVVVVGG
jgi:hypothetical protein